MMPDDIVNAAMQEGAAQKRDEFAGLVDFLWNRREYLNTVVEIGTMTGGTLKAWCELASEYATIVSVDLPGGEWGGGYPESHIPHLQSFAKPTQRLELIRADSTESVDLVKETCGDPVDLLFIDGDHSYEGVYLDFTMYAPLVAKGGLIIFHDILEHTGRPACEVSKLWQAIKGDFKHWEFAVQGDERGYGPWGGIGVIEWQP